MVNWRIIIINKFQMLIFPGPMAYGMEFVSGQIPVGSIPNGVRVDLEWEWIGVRVDLEWEWITRFPQVMDGIQKIQPKDANYKNPSKLKKSPKFFWAELNCKTQKFRCHRADLFLSSSAQVAQNLELCLQLMIRNRLTWYGKANIYTNTSSSHSRPFLPFEKKWNSPHIL